MSLIVDLSPAEEREVQQHAAREGVSVSEYVRRRILPPDPTKPYEGTDKPFNVLQFAGIVPRSQAEVEAHVAEVEASRDEWDVPYWRQTVEQTPTT